MSLPLQKHEAADVVVIGGGPAGSSAALHLAQAGFHVIQLERRVFGDPANDRFRSGEAILASTATNIAALSSNMTTATWALNPVDQIALHWPWKTGSLSQLRPTAMIHVDRERFDAMLFHAAEAAGVDGRQGWRVSGFADAANGVLATAPGDTLPHCIAANIIIDAGGRSSLSHRQFNLRRSLALDDFFAMAMFFDCVADVADRTWEMHFFDPVHLTTVQLSRITAGVVRCGLGTTRAMFRASRLAPANFFWQRLGAAPELYQRFAESRTISRPFVRVAIGYGVDTVAFDGLVLAGDAAGYVNPIFGDGIARALRDGYAVAAAVSRALRRGTYKRAAFASYVYRHMLRAALDRLLARCLRLGYAAPSKLIRAA